MVSAAATAGEDAVWRALADVIDPELPVLSVIDLGLVHEVRVEGGRAHIRFTPTFVGCPAVDQMRLLMAEAVRGLGLEPDVDTTYDAIWTSARITPDGRRKLADAGIAPPGDAPVRTGLSLPVRAVATCPHCGSEDTRRDNAFGPTPCRAIWYCDSCRQPFEGFKSI
jgi:ring-1,2-phenylacetyl-CoA epoxidase subunit PaaD